MPSAEGLDSSPLPASASKEDALAYYKSQYEQLEAELADFQASSRELEAELEKDVEAAEKRERQLQEKVEALGYEVEEWKSKCKQSKAEANTAQNTLQKEITTLRDSNRTMQLKLRDIEVANDDFERQARNTTSSLEDLESKYNVGIERNVLLEEEVKLGEQEREALRIETQRLRDELSDLKVEAEIRQDKLRHAEAASERQRMRKLTPISATISRPRSSISEHSPTTTASSPTVATPPTKSASSTTSDTPTPPSPPVSDKSMPAVTTTTAASIPKSRLSVSTSSVTPRPSHYSSRAPRHSRGPSLLATNGFSTPAARRTTLNRPESRQGQLPNTSLPSSASLTQIRGLIGKMQKLEQRVQSARSKLPAPTATPPRASPRPGSSLGDTYIPASITVRSQRKRTGGSIVSGTSSVPTTDDGSDPASSSKPRLSRLSYGRTLAAPLRDNTQSNGESSRPSSRASMSSRQQSSNFNSGLQSSLHSSRPSSRQSISGARTPLGHYSSNTANSEARARPRSSIGGSYSSLHGHSQSVSINRLSDFSVEESADGGDVLTPTPSRRTTLSKEGTGIPTPRTLNKRRSGSAIGGFGRRTSSGPGISGIGDMGPPLQRKERSKKLGEIGETY